MDGVFLNGHGPFRFVLDTGAQSNQIAKSIALKLGLVPAFRVEMATVSGAIQVAGGRSAQVSVGSATASNQEFLFTTLDGAHALSSQIKGVLGQEFLGRFDYLLDFVNHRLVFGAPAPEGGDRVSFENLDGCSAIETSEGKLVLDTGTNMTILYRSPLSPDGQLILTASGAASASTIHGLRLRIGGREYHPARAASVPKALLKGDGLLPANLFRAIFVSNSGRYVILDPGADSRATAPRRRCGTRTC